MRDVTAGVLSRFTLDPPHSCAARQGNVVPPLSFGAMFSRSEVPDLRAGCRVGPEVLSWRAARHPGGHGRAGTYPSLGPRLPVGIAGREQQQRRPGEVVKPPVSTTTPARPRR